MNRTPIPVITYDRGTITGSDTLGFENVPDLVRNKSRSHGFFLNILMIGRKGAGATTLINSLFQAKIAGKRTDELTTYTAQLLENDICLTLSVSVYHGINALTALQVIEEGHAKHFRNENLHTESVDSRIHCCLFLLPTDDLFPNEIEMLRKISQHCNLIPVLPKADAFTKNELYNFRVKMQETFVKNGIKCFEPPEYLEDDEFAKEVNDLKTHFPLATIAGDCEISTNNVIKRGREYKWGFLNMEDEEISDLLRLRKLLIANHLDDLVMATENSFYDEYRKKALEKIHSENNNATKLQRIKNEMEKILAERNAAIIKKIEDDIKRLEMELNAKKSCILLNNERNNLFSKL